MKLRPYIICLSTLSILSSFDVRASGEPADDLAQYILEKSSGFMEKYELSLYKPGSEPEEVSAEDISRIKVVNTLLAVYSRLNKFGRFSRCVDEKPNLGPISRWKFMGFRDPGGKESFHYILIPHPDNLFGAAEEALGSSAPGADYVVCCTKASVIAKSVVLIGGHTGFIFKPLPIDPYDYTLHFISTNTPVKTWGEFKKKKQNAKPGDFLYFSNFVIFSGLHNSPSMGENVFLCGYDNTGAGRYIGFGEQFKEGPITSESIRANFVKAMLSPMDPKVKACLLLSESPSQVAELLAQQGIAKTKRSADVLNNEFLQPFWTDGSLLKFLLGKSTGPEVEAALTDKLSALLIREAGKYISIKTLDSDLAPSLAAASSTRDPRK